MWNLEQAYLHFFLNAIFNEPQVGTPWTGAKPPRNARYSRGFVCSKPGLTTCGSQGGAGFGIHYKSEADPLKPGWEERRALSLC